MFSISRIGGIAGRAGSAAAGGGGAVSPVFDTFTEASEIALDSHTPDVGTGWTLEIDDGSGGIKSRVPELDAGWVLGRSGKTSIYTVQPGPTSAEYDIIVDLRISPEQADAPVWLLARFLDTDNYYAAGIMGLSTENPDLVIIKNVASVITTLDSADESIDMTVSRLVKFEIRDAAKKLYIDGVEKLSSVDNALTAAGEVALGGGGVDGTFRTTIQGWSIDNLLVIEF